jgi:hypothetical protein
LVGLGAAAAILGAWVVGAVLDAVHRLTLHS